ncbi:hypothetical protein MOBT1_001995 [Malassezia obtusa]|uniref:VTT domain-containing protein n=1 Tax=Malassezia obtusa TaxID=76774 RepID=A0AAF0IWQ7_9BASI|nr:hypothetical protein MOBT1_001995 [Malassezia obtusa]
MSLRNFIRLDRRIQPEHKPGTPDVTLSPPRREHGRNVRSEHIRSPETTEDTPRFSGLRSFLTKVTPGTSSESSGERRTPPLTKLVMPSARRAAVPMLNEDSPPLSPVHDEASDHGRETPVNDTASISSERPHYVPPRHAWSAAQAAADAVASPDVAVMPKPIDSWARTTEPLPFPVLNERHSPPSSLSSVPSLTWSSNDDDNKLTSQKSQPISSFLSRIYRASARRILAEEPQLRADVDPSTRPFSLALLAPHAWKLVLLALSFVLATAFLGMCLRTLPLHLPTHLAQLTLTEVRDMCAGLKEYARSNTYAMLHVWVVLSIFFTWKQAFCVPGSLITNIVFGAMYGAYFGSFFASILTALGGVLCYLLAMPFGEVVALVPGISKPLGAMQKALAAPLAHGSSGTGARIPLRPRSHDRTSRRVSGEMPRSAASGVRRNLWSYLLFLRLLPIVPYGMMNIACGVLRVPLVPYAVTLAVGSVPWNFCTAQIGEILQDVVSAIQTERSHQVASNAMAGGMVETSSSASGAADSFLASGMLSVLLERVWTVDMMVKLLLLSVASALPIVLQRIFGKQNVEDAAALEEGSSEPESPIDTPRRVI